MIDASTNQFYSFLIFIGTGILIVLIFDFFRIFRKSFKTPDFLTVIEDIIFWIIVGLLLMYSIIKLNNGELRLYIFIGLAIGSAIYLLTISNIFIKINVIIINCIVKTTKNIINIISFPLKISLKFLRKIFLKPISFFFINFKKYFTKNNEKFIILTRKKKIEKGF